MCRQSRRRIRSIDAVNIQSIDLNLLVAFNALMQERNLTRAGALIGLSQPSMSHALARLRKICGDPLFVRVRTGMEPTPFAERIADPVRHGLDMLRSSVASAMTFDPATSDRTFKVLISDIGEVAYLPRLMSHLGNEAPGVNLRAIQLPRERYQEAFESGEVDLAIGFLPGAWTAFFQQRLFDDTYACLARTDHPRIRASLSLAQFSAESHVVVEPAGSAWEGMSIQTSTTALIEHHLLGLGVSRRIALRVPHFMAVTAVIEDTDLLVTLPSYALKFLARTHRVKTFPLPVDAPTFQVKQFWHERNHHDAGNRWLRGVVAKLFLTPQPGP